MKYKAVLFDLDGTLLPLDVHDFIRHYFAALAKKVSPYIEPAKFMDALMAGTGDMMVNDGSRTNSEVFMDKFFAMVDTKPEQMLPIFEDFYANEYKLLGRGLKPLSQARKAVEHILNTGTPVIVATNPLFPATAVETRLEWAGLTGLPFAHVTSYENSSFCKPNPGYYQEILAKLGISGMDCLMVGNDPVEDLAASELGLDTFLVDDYLVERETPYSPTWQGNWNNFLQYIEKLTK